MKQKNNDAKNGLPTHGADEVVRAIAIEALTGKWIEMFDPMHLPLSDEQDLLEASDAEGNPEDRVVDEHPTCFNCHFSTKRCVGCQYDSETEH